LHNPCSSRACIPAPTARSSGTGAAAVPQHGVQRPALLTYPAAMTRLRVAAACSQAAATHTCASARARRLLWPLVIYNAFTAYYCLDGGNAWDFTSGNGQLFTLTPGCSPANSATDGFCATPATYVGRYYQQAGTRCWSPKGPPRASCITVFAASVLRSVVRSMRGSADTCAGASRSSRTAARRTASPRCPPPPPPRPRSARPS